MSQKSVLFIYTSADKLLDGQPTGWYLPEAAHPFYVLRDQVKIDFVAPKGPNPPVDPVSVEQFKGDDQSQKFLNDQEVTIKLNEAKTLDQINVADYDAVFYPGGHGPMIDLPTDPLNIKLLNEFWAAGKIVAAVCHGPAALVGATDSTGKSIISGNKVTGFSNVEEEQAGKTVPKHMSFLLETKLVELGGNYGKAAEPWGENVVVDGKLITGQNPASAKGVGEAILKALS